MISEHKIQDILKYVWYPKPEFQKNTVLLNALTQAVFQLLNDENDIATISQYLYEQSVQRCNTQISTEKCDEVVTLLMAWYSPRPPVHTSYGIIRLYNDYGYLRYKNAQKKLEIKLDTTINTELVLYPDEIDLDEEEKMQLINAIKQIYSNHKLLIYSDQNAEYIDENLEYW